MSEPLKHKPGPVVIAQQRDCTDEYNAFLGPLDLHLHDRIGDDDCTLLTLYQTAPHVCADPSCPGDRNRRKLEMFGELLSACEEMRAFIGIMFGKGDDAITPQHIASPLGPSIRLGDIVLQADNALARAKELME